jgi:hypothetical protein
MILNLNILEKLYRILFIFHRILKLNQMQAVLIQEKQIILGIGLKLLMLLNCMKLIQVVRWLKLLQIMLIAINI